MRKALLVLTIIVLFCGLVEAKSHVWQDGKVLDLLGEGYTTYGGARTTGHVYPYGNVEATTTQASWNHFEEGIIIEGKVYIWYASRILSFRWQKGMNVTVNAPIKFALEKDKLYVLDESGREHKLRINKRVKK